MKKILCFAIVLLSLNAIAQEKKSKKLIANEHHKTELHNESAEVLAKTETKKLTKQLELTTNQQSEVYTVFLNHFEEELKLKKKIKEMTSSKNETNKEDIKKSVREVRYGLQDKLNTQLKKILTPEQYKSFEETNLKNRKIKQKNERKKY